MTKKYKKKKEEGRRYSTTKIRNFKTITVGFNERKSVVELKIIGEIHEPREYVREFYILEELSVEYRILQITLNSPGGSLATLLELLSLIKKFDYIITVGKGRICSAAFVIWCAGNLRIADDYSVFMAHRESYGNYGKTTEHLEYAEKIDEINKSLFRNYLSGILTRKEMEKIKTTEVWLSYKDLINRGHAKSIDFLNNVPLNHKVYNLLIDSAGNAWLFDAESEIYRAVIVQDTGQYVDNLNHVLFGTLSDEHVKQVDLSPEELEELKEQSSDSEVENIPEEGNDE